MTRWSAHAVALVVCLSAGCASSTPSVPASTTMPPNSQAPAPTLTPPSSAPSPSASPLADVFGSDWVPVEFGGDNAHPWAAVFGDAGPVIVGATCKGPVDAPDC